MINKFKQVCWIRKEHKCSTNRSGVLESEQEVYLFWTRSKLRYGLKISTQRSLKKSQQSAHSMAHGIMGKMLAEQYQLRA